LASRSTVRGLGGLITRAIAIFGVALIGFALSRHAVLSATILVAAGYGMMTATASMNTIIQTIVDEEMRGRVMAMYTMAFIGLSPVGALLAGALADRVGAPLTVGIGGTFCVLLAVWFNRQLPELRDLVRPIYERMGIIPEVATGLHATDRTPGAQG